MTSVTSSGYSSKPKQPFDPLQLTSGSTTSNLIDLSETAEDKAKKMEREGDRNLIIFEICNTECKMLS